MGKTDSLRLFANLGLEREDWLCALSSIVAPFSRYKKFDASILGCFHERKLRGQTMVSYSRDEHVNSTEVQCSIGSFRVEWDDYDALGGKFLIRFVILRYLIE
jgi:hypothetical protein